MSDRSAPVPSTAETDKTDSSQFVGFELAGQQYAFRIDKIQEIVIPDQVTPTPQVADCVEGVSNLRGAIIPIINLRKLLGLAPKKIDAETRTIVVNVDERTMGCTVDAVSHVMRIPHENIQPAPDSLTADGSEYIDGFANLNESLVILLNVDKLLDPEMLHRPAN